MGENKESNSEIENLSFIKDRININSDKDYVSTRLNICKDMLDLLDESEFRDNNKVWADIYCKSGNIIDTLIKRGVSTEKTIMICPTEQSQLLVCRRVYGEELESVSVDVDIDWLKTVKIKDGNRTKTVYIKITRRGQAYYISNWDDIIIESKEKAIGIIKGIIGKEYNKSMGLEWKDTNDFNISNIVTNPPYNDDLYIAFVELSKAIAKDNVVAITPAKWQAKGGKDNDNFRQNIVPFIHKIVNYIDCGDVFNIRLQGGVAYYLIKNDKCDEKIIINHCSRNKSFECTKPELRKFNTDIIFINNDKLYAICNKVGCLNNDFKPWKFGATPIKDNYNVFATAINTDAGGKTSFHIFSLDGKLTMLAPFTIRNETFFRSKDTKCFYTSSSKSCAESFISWANTKFVRFMLLMRYCTYHNDNNESWSFVPDPEKFDHIFTDEELYKKYNLTSEEIEIIESVIKERS